MDSEVLDRDAPGQSEGDATLTLRVVDHAGVEHEVEALEGWRVMEVIRDWDIGIKAECGGACACATCHVYVEPEWLEAVGKPEPMEEDMLDFAWEVKPNSRLSCQIKIGPALDGLKLTTPERQG